MERVEAGSGEVAGRVKGRHYNGSGPTAKMRKFFIDNPGEELSKRDVQIKFGISGEGARQAIARMCANGDLAVLRKEGRICFYGRAK